MYDEDVVLCASSAYEQKYYFNHDFDSLPDMIKDELQIMCVLFTEEAGGIITLKFNSDGSLLIETDADEGDLLYDDIACGLLIKRIQRDKRQLLESVELYYKVFLLGENIEFSDEKGASV